MDNRKRIAMIITITIICCAIMAVVDGIIKPHYAVKSGIKLVLFLGLPLIYSLKDRNLSLKQVFKVNKKGLALGFGLCVPLYILILGAYLCLKDFFDFSGITASLTENIGVSRDNFVLVSIYISFINSFLEEFFFRGFACLTLKRFTSVRFAYIFSSLTFALYHVAMMIGWFGAGLFVLVMLGLFVGGMIFNSLNSKSDNIYTSWLVHAFANFAINTIGFMLFGII